MVPKTVQYQGKVGVAGGQLGVTLPVHEDQEVAGPVEEPQGHTRLLGVVAVQGEVDVGGHCGWMVHTHHPLHDQGGLVLVAQGQGGVPEDVGDLGHGPSSWMVAVVIVMAINNGSHGDEQ